jgi:hypothetical protein
VASITFGLSQTYDWSSTYWSTLTNVQDTNITDYNTFDGWKLLAFATPFYSFTFTSMTGWTETSGENTDSLIVDESYLKQYTSNGTTNHTLVGKTSILSAAAKASTFYLAKIPIYATSTATAGSKGARFEQANDTYWSSIELRSDGTNIDVYSYNNSWALGKRLDSSLPAETSRYHLIGVGNEGSSNTTLEFWYDGELLASNIPCVSYKSLKECTLYVCGDTPNPESHVRSVWNWASSARFATADGVMESKSDAAIFDAGAGDQWATLSWTHDTSNSTAITYQVRCAASVAALADASYETIAASGNSIVTKGRYIQIKLTLADASSGQYTPILKTLTATDEAAPSASIGKVAGVAKASIGKINGVAIASIGKVAGVTK